MKFQDYSKLQDKISFKVFYCLNTKYNLFNYEDCINFLASKTGKGFKRIQKLLTIGLDRSFTIMDVERFARALDVPVEQLFVFDDIENSELKFKK